jgi:hypothetical protein
MRKPQRIATVGAQKGNDVEQRQRKSYPNALGKSNLKIVPADGGAQVKELRLGGLAPSEDMAPGKYLVMCETAWTEQIGKGVRVVLQFRCVDGKYDGVALRQWLSASNGGNIVSPTGRYARHCAIALGRPLTQDDPVNDPAAIFAGQKFLVFVGYRKTERQRGGMASEDNALRRKDEGDYLRVHEIISSERL